MVTTIFLIRHGEVDNPEDIIYGRLPNYRLSEKGEIQVKKTAEFLTDKHIDAIYSSPLTRALQSAEIIKDTLHLSAITISDEVTEGLTSYQVKKFNELDLLQSEVYLKPLNPTHDTVEKLAK